MSNGEPTGPRGDSTDRMVRTGGTAGEARRIFKRFVLVLLAVNTLIGTALVVFTVYDSLRHTHQELEGQGGMNLGAARRLRHELSHQSDVEVMRRAAYLLDVPLALVGRDGQLAEVSTAEIRGAARKIYGGKVVRGTRVRIDDELGALSGAWVVGRFSQSHDLLAVVVRRPEDEGLAIYMTIAAGLTGVGMLISFLVMLLAANWMLHRPLRVLVNRLTGALARDMERRRRAEERAVAARQEAEKHLAFMNSLIDASEAVGIVAVDNQDRIQIFNFGAAEILGYRPDEVLRRMTLSELRQRQPAETGRSPLIQLREGEELWTNSAGRQLQLYVARSVIHDAVGGAQGRLLTFIDVSEERKLEAELKLNEMQLIQSAKLATLGEMATGIAHELNQPLNNIGLLASRIRRRLDRLPPDGQQREFYDDKLEKLQSQIQRASAIIDHLRTFGRPTPSALRPVAVHEPVQGVMVFLREQLQRRGIDVRVELPEALPLALMDSGRMEQVLMNLLINARDALEQMGDPRPGEAGKRITVRAEARALASGEPGVAVEVADNGPGIPQEVLGRVFEPFFSTKEVGKGTGLGLSISYGLVRDFGGSLEVTSSERWGTCFTITLKAGTSQETEAA